MRVRLSRLHAYAMGRMDQSDCELLWAGAAAMLPSIAKIAELLGGEVSGSQVLCPGPGHDVGDRSLSVKLDNG